MTYDEPRKAQRLHADRAVLKDIRTDVGNNAARWEHAQPHRAQR